jgi:DNA-binding Lrp family transcriptional regulator
MLTRKEKIILKHLRKNSRKGLNQIAKEENIPILEIVEAYLKIENRYIKKYTSLLDFDKLGYLIKYIFILNGDREVIKCFLTTHPNVNTVSTLNDNSFYAEAVFRTMKEYYEFNSFLDKFNLTKKDSHPIIKEIKIEEFNL